ncbi:MAG: glycosyltransferase [Candidatus Omnitrophica bacterium]|nr:glycosyltransferase [Candidatus Omnitrophota bacterium]
MKIIHLIPGIPFSGGAENIVRDLCRSIDTARFKLEVWYWNDNDDLAPDILAAGALPVKLPLKKIVSPASVFYIARLLKARKAGLIHTHFFDADLLGFAASRLAGTPMITHVHSHPFLSCARHSWRYRWMGQLGIARIVCVSGYVRDHVKGVTGLGAEKFEVIPNGINGEVFKDQKDAAARNALRASLGLAEDDLVIGNVSRLIEDKGHAVLLRALADVMAVTPQVKGLIIGDGVLAANLRALARDLGIASKVVFAGRRHDVPELLGCMDLFVCPTYREAFGLSVLEAMSAGKPVIASNDAGMVEIIRDGLDGILLKPGDSTILSKAMLALINDPPLMRRMALSAQERSGAFTLQAMAGRFESLYERVGKKDGCDG